MIRKYHQLPTYHKFIPPAPSPRRCICACAAMRRLSLPSPNRRVLQRGAAPRRRQTRSGRARPTSWTSTRRSPSCRPPSRTTRPTASSSPPSTSRPSRRRASATRGRRRGRSPRSRPPCPRRPRRPRSHPATTNPSPPSAALNSQPSDSARRLPKASRHHLLPAPWACNASRESAPMKTIAARRRISSRNSRCPRTSRASRSWRSSVRAARAYRTRNPTPSSPGDSPRRISSTRSVAFFYFLEYFVFWFSKFVLKWHLTA